MPRRKTETDKQAALRQHGTLNPRPQDVRHPLFQGSDFFDPDDIVQVKYEMLRQVNVDNRPISQAAHEFGLSRPSFYQANSTFEHAGLAGFQQGSQVQQAPSPPSHGRRVWRSRRVGDVGNGSLPVAIGLAQQLPRLLPAVEAVVC